MGTWRAVHVVALGATLAGWIATACGQAKSTPTAGYGDDDEMDYDGDTGAATPDESDSAFFDAGVPSVRGVPVLPEETELDPEFELPHAGAHYVYAVNPDRDSVAIIDATTLAIHSVDAGDEPKFLQTLAGEDSAIVLNVKSNDATVIRTRDGKSTTSFVDVASGANVVAVAADGRHAVAYLNSDYATGDSADLESQSVSVLTLAPGEDRSAITSVGYRPRAVFFSDDGKRGFVVTDDGVSILDFESIDAGESAIAHTVSISGTFDIKSLDVSVTRDGTYALARQQGGDVLRLVDLGTEEAFEIDVTPIVAAARPPVSDDDTGGAGAAGVAGAPSSNGSEPEPVQAQITDVDLSPDNTFAVAVVRSDGVVLKIPVPDGFEDPGGAVTTYTIDTGVIGSATLSPDAQSALLYTTADGNEKNVTLLNLETGALNAVRLQKSVQSVAIASDGGTALVVHQKQEGDPAVATDEATRLERSHGYSAIDLETRFVRLVLTESEIMAFTLPEGSESLFVLLSKPYQVQRLPFGSLVPDSLPLASEPLSIGAVPSSERIFVGQQHPDGRITFIDWNTMEMTSVTGFELNSEIQER